MSRRTILEVTCDDCGKVEQLETFKSQPLTATLNPSEMLEKGGWRQVPVVGSRFQTYDRCPKCSERGT